MFFKDEVKGLAGFNGKKVASAGLNLRYLQGTGAVGQQGSLVSYYNKIKTGVADSTMLWAEAVNKFKIVEVAPYMLKADIGSVNSKAITINTKKWKSLPAEVQKVIAEAAIAYRDHMEVTVVKVAAKSYANFKKRGGTIHVMSDADRKKWATTMPNVAKDWAATLEKKGIPAKAILSAYMDTMRANKQPILRQWDKE